MWDGVEGGGGERGNERNVEGARSGSCSQGGLRPPLDSLVSRQKAAELPPYVAALCRFGARTFLPFWRISRDA